MAGKVGPPMFVEYVKYLVDWYGAEFFKNLRNHNHAAFKDYHLLNNYLTNYGCGSSDQEFRYDFVINSMRALLNAIVIGSVTPKDKIFTGITSSINDSLQRKINGAKTKQKNYEALLGEFNTAYWLNDKPNYDYIEECGLPDFLSRNDEVIVETKTFISATSLNNWVHKKFNDARTKVKNTERVYGTNFRSIIFFDMSRYLSTLRFFNETEKYAERINHFDDLVRNELRKSKINSVIYYYDRFVVMDNLGNVECHRMSELIDPDGIAHSANLGKYQMFTHLAFRMGSHNRNSPCLCGSGRRFKHCHGRLI